MKDGKGNYRLSVEPAKAGVIPAHEPVQLTDVVTYHWERSDFEKLGLAVSQSGGLEERK